MDSLSSGVAVDGTAGKPKKPSGKQVASRYLQSASKTGLQQIDNSQTAIKQPVSRQGFTARTTGKWGSSHQNTQPQTSQSTSALHLVDVSTTATAHKPTQFAAPDIKASKRYVPATPAVPESPERGDTWVASRTDTSGADSHRPYDNDAEPMELDDDDATTSSRHSQDPDDETEPSSTHMKPGSVSAKPSDHDKHLERLRQLEEFRQKKQAQKLLQSTKKAPPPSGNPWRHSASGLLQHELANRRDSLRGPRLSRPASPTNRRHTMSNPPPKFSVSSGVPGNGRESSAVLANPQQEAALQQAAQALAEGKVTEMLTSPISSPVAHSHPSSAPSLSISHSRPSSAPSLSTSDAPLPQSQHETPGPSSPHANRTDQIRSDQIRTDQNRSDQNRTEQNKHASSDSSRSMMSVSGPGPVGPGSGTWLRESVSSTGSGSTHGGSHAGDKPMSEAERAEQFKRRRRNMQKWILMFRHLSLRAVQSLQQRTYKAEGEMEAMLFLAAQLRDEAAALERQAARRQREQQLDDCLARQLPLLEQHQRQEAQSTAVLHTLQEGLLAALTHVPLVNGACVGSNPGAPEIPALQRILQKGVGVMMEMQEAMDRLTEPLQPALPSTCEVGDTDDVAAVAAASLSCGKGGVELAAEVAKALIQTMTQEVKELHECSYFLQKLKAKEIHNASYRVMLVQMKQAGLL